MFNEKKSKKVVGVKQSIKVLKNLSDFNGITVCIAKDAEERVISPILDTIKDKTISVQYINTMKELGKLCGIDVGAAVALIFDDVDI